jgi:hypothetical protein
VFPREAIGMDVPGMSGVLHLRPDSVGDPSQEILTRRYRFAELRPIEHLKSRISALRSM